MGQFKNKHIMVILGILFIFIAIPRLMFPDLDHGDEFSDADALNAGRNYAKFGFIKCYFLPMFELYDSPKEFYTHYPPLPEIINGLFQKFKIHSLYFFRGFALFFALLNLLFWYLFVRKSSGSNLIGFLAAFFYFTNPFFIFGMDSVMQLSYSDCLRSSILLIFITMPSYSVIQKKTYIVVLWILLFIQSLISYEYIVYLSVFFILFSFFFKESKNAVSKKGLLILFSASVTGFFLHILQNAWYFGSFKTAFVDLKSRAITRMFFSEDVPLPVFNFFTWFKYVIARNFSLIFIFNYFILALMLAFSYFLCQNLPPKQKTEIKRVFRLCILLTICGVTWYITFPSHAFAHTFVKFLVRHIVPVASVAFALFSYIIISFVRENNPRNLFGKIAVALIIIVIGARGILGSELPITGDSINRAKDFLIFKKCLLNLREMSNRKDRVGVNYYRNPFMRYYTNRQFQAIFEKAALEKLSPLPEYFILFPYNNPRTQELFQTINQKYTILFQCNSLVFPGLFFKLKKD